MKDLSQIVLEMIASLNAIENKKNRLIEISVDGQITEDEFQDFTVIQDQLSKIAMSVDTLQLWVQKTIAEGKIDKEIFDQYKEQVQ